MKQPVKKAVAALEELLEAAEDVALDLQDEIRGRYGYPEVHPYESRRFERDMASVDRVFEAMELVKVRFKLDQREKA